MGELMEEAKRRLDEVVHGSKESEQPPPSYDFGQWSPNPPAPPPADDRYMHPGGGFGFHTEDAREAQRVQVELQAAEARRQARGAQVEQDPVRQRIAELERRIAELEGRGEQP